MRRERPSPKAPKIDVLARHYLGIGLSQHPDIATDDARAEEVRHNMQMWALLDLARKMGVDADDIIRKAEIDEKARNDYSWKYPAFKGELPFDLTFSFLGKTVTRKAKVVYTHTPEWPYFDLQKQAEYEGWPSSSYHIELTAVPQEQDAETHEMIDQEPEWFEAQDLVREGVITHEIWDVVIDAIDDKCKVEDAERRRIAAARRTSPSAKSKRKH